MSEFLESEWAVPIMGILCGLLLGAIARRSHFCTLTSLERHWYSEDSSGLRTWALAAIVALVATQILMKLELASLEQSFYLSSQINFINIIIGGLLFGFGMALVGTCGFGALIRLGSGSLRSLIIVVTMGLAALSAQRGSISALRNWSNDQFAITLPHSQSAADLLNSLGLSFLLTNAVLIVAVMAFIVWVFSNSDFRKQTSSILTGFVIGGCIALGWFITSTLQAYQFEPVQLEAGSFVLPPGELILHAVFAQAIPDYGVGLVAGVIIGAFMTSLVQRNIRWEACDDARELSRHLAGGLLMGVGGVFASGCTIGQGLSAFSLLAISAPIAIISIIIGARLGLSFLIEGSAFAFAKS